MSKFLFFSYYVCLMLDEAFKTVLYLLTWDTWCMVSRAPGRGVVDTYRTSCVVGCHQVVCTNAVHHSSGFPPFLLSEPNITIIFSSKVYVNSQATLTVKRKK